MTSIVPPNPPPPPLPSPGSQVTVTVQNPPPALTQLPAGAIIDAEVIVSSAKGVTELNSVFGKLAIKTSLPLPENTKIDLQILRTTPQLQLLIKALNNTPIQSSGQSSGQAPGQPPGTTGNVNEAIKTILQTALKSPSITPSNPQSATPSATPIKFDIGALIKATLLRPIGNTAEPPPPAAAKSAPTNPPSTPDANAKPAASGSLGKTQGKPGSIPTEAVKPGLERAPQQPNQEVKNSSTSQTAKLAAQLRAGTQLSLRFIGLSSAPSAPAAPPANVINGTVVATTPNGQPILNTPLGMIAIDSRVPLSPGQSLRLEIIPSQIQLPAASSAETRFENMFMSRDWPNLSDAIREIAQTAPAVSQKLIGSTLPQANTQLTSNTLFFLNALKGGDMRAWMGNAAATLLNQINPELMGQLDEDFAQLGRAVVEPQVNDWRTAVVPFFSGLGLEQFQMHTQGQQQEGEDGNKVAGSRFIIDVSLSLLGRIQLDGFVRNKGKRLDLIVRTDGPLPNQMQNDIRTIYGDFTEATGAAGQISFQADQKFVEIAMPHLADHPNKGIVI